MQTEDDRRGLTEDQRKKLRDLDVKTVVALVRDPDAPIREIEERSGKYP